MPQKPPASRYQAMALFTAFAVSFDAEKDKPQAERGEQRAEHGKPCAGGFYKTFGIQQKIAQPGQGEQDHKSFHWQLRKCEFLCLLRQTAARGSAEIIKNRP